MGRIAPTSVGTKKSQGRDEKLPTEGRVVSSVGTKSFQRWKRSFPALEKKISSLGNYFSKEGNLLETLQEAFKRLAGNLKKGGKGAGGLELAEEVLDGGEGVVEEHTWTGPAHHRLNAGFHVGSVAVYGAFAAGRLRCSVAATV